MFGARELLLLLVVAGIVWFAAGWSRRLRRNRDAPAERGSATPVDLIECQRCKAYRSARAPGCDRADCPMVPAGRDNASVTSARYTTPRSDRS